MSRSRAKGTAWESAIVAYLRERGWPHAERRTLSGAQDRGDVAGVVGVVIEAKNTKAVNLAEFLDEARLEAHYAGAAIGAAWVHRRGKSSPADGYVVMDGATFTRLLIESGYQ